jgi:hypothetical protein
LDENAEETAAMPLTPDDGNDLTDTASDKVGGQGIEAMVQERPIAAAAIAALIGFLIAKIVF